LSKGWGLAEDEYKNKNKNKNKNKSEGKGGDKYLEHPDVR
jgi:hypothetical protein